MHLPREGMRDGGQTEHVDLHPDWECVARMRGTSRALELNTVEPSTLRPYFGDGNAASALLSIPRSEEAQLLSDDGKNKISMRRRQIK